MPALKNQSPKVSIITPFKNAELFLAETARSIFDQTYTNWEWILVNDHSDQNEVDSIRIFLKDSRVKLLMNEGYGIVDALTMAQRHATGDYLTRMDADDLMPMNKLELLVKTIQATDAAIVTGKVSYFRNEGDVSTGYLNYENWLNKQIDLQDFYLEIYRECTIASGNWLMKRDVFDLCGGFTGLVYPEDYDLLFRWYKRKLKIIGVNEITHLWRDHERRTSRNSKLYSQQYFFKLKVKHFLEIDFSGEPLVVNGDGSKGKLVVKELRKQQIPFYWVGKVARQVRKNNQTIKILSPKDLPNLESPILLNTTLIESNHLKELYGDRLTWKTIIQL